MFKKWKVIFSHPLNGYSDFTLSGSSFWKFYERQLPVWKNIYHWADFLPAIELSESMRSVAPPPAWLSVSHTGHKFSDSRGSLLVQKKKSSYWD